jgi:hypothetical protein
VEHSILGEALVMRTEFVGMVDGLKTWNVYDDAGTLVGTNQSPPDPPAVPDSLTAVQIRLWLVAHGITLEQVDAAIAALPDETREATRIEWEYSATIHRGSSTLVAMATTFGMDSAAIDAAFVEASGM